MAEKPSIHLYTGQTANGIKISILLEELGLKYDVSWPLHTNFCRGAIGNSLTGEAGHHHRHEQERPEGALLLHLTSTWECLLLTEGLGALVP